jgi:hypothetical protein
MSLIHLFSFCLHSSRDSSMSWVCSLLGLSHLRKKRPISREIARIQSSIVNYCENSIYYFLFRQCFDVMSFLQHIPDSLKGFGETEVCYINSFVRLFKRYTKAWRQTTYLVKGSYTANQLTFNITLRNVFENFGTVALNQINWHHEARQEGHWLHQINQKFLESL